MDDSETRTAIEPDLYWFLRYVVETFASVCGDAFSFDFGVDAENQRTVVASVVFNGDGELTANVRIPYGEDARIAAILSCASLYQQLERKNAANRLVVPEKGIVLPR